MARRTAELFNLSFLDLLSGALGAVIFLFIITPKGGEAPSTRHQVAISMDTAHKHIFGVIDDSLVDKKTGDTLLVLIKDFEKMPTIKNCPKCPPPKKCPKCPEGQIAKRKGSQPINNGGTGKKDNQRNPDNTTTSESNEPKTVYKGTLPSVPCKVSIEINWENDADNVDLFVCKGKSCVYGRRRDIKNIGQWDSGKSKTTFFGGDLRTNQEAVRQFKEIIPGDYEIYAQFKEQGTDKSTVSLRGLIYTKNDDGQEKGKRFYKILSYDKRERTLIGMLSLEENGEFSFTKK